MPWCELILLLIFLSLMETYNAASSDHWNPLLCTCRNIHPQTMFCNAHFAIRVVILQNPRNRQRRFRMSEQSLMNFPVEIQEIYKGSHIFPNEHTSSGRSKSKKMRQRIYLYSPFGPACTITKIVERRRYVLMGYVVEGKPVVSRCTWKRLEDDLTRRQQKGLVKKYKENCHSCSINYCTDTKHCPEEQFKCNLNVLSAASDCYHAETFCLRKNHPFHKLGFKCKWAHSRVRLKQCIRARCRGDPTRCPEQSGFGR